MDSIFFIIVIILFFVYKYFDNKYEFEIQQALELKLLSEINKNRGKILKSIDNFQSDLKIYKYDYDDRCKKFVSANNEITIYQHFQNDIHKCCCGWKIKDEYT